MSDNAANFLGYVNVSCPLSTCLMSLVVAHDSLPLWQFIKSDHCTHWCIQKLQSRNLVKLHQPQLSSSDKLSPSSVNICWSSLLSAKRLS